MQAVLFWQLRHLHEPLNQWPVIVWLRYPEGDLIHTCQDPVAVLNSRELGRRAMLAQGGRPAKWRVFVCATRD